MVGKVAEVERILGDGDSLAKDISSIYEQYYTQFSPKREEVKELRNYLFATDTTKTTNSKLPWKNKTTLPKLAQMRENLHANYMAALFPNDDWFVWEGYTEDAVTLEKRRVIQAYMKNKTRESDFQQTVSKLVYDWIDTGNTFGEVVYVNEQKVDPETKEVIPGYIGPKLERTSYYDHVFNLAAPSYKDSPKITRYVKSIGELEDEITTRPELGIDSAVLEKIKSRRNSLRQFRNGDLDKAEAYYVDGFGSLTEYYGSGMVEILEFEGDIYDKEGDVFYKDYLITIVDRSWVARKKQNPSWLGKSGRHHCGWKERPDSLWAMGPLDNLVGLQYRVDHLENLKADALDLTIHPPVKIVGNVEPFTWAPLEQIHIADADGDVVPLAPNPAAFQVNNEIMLLLQLMEEMAGAPKEAMGVRTPGEKTAFEVDRLMNAASRIFQDKVTKFEKEFIEPVLNTMLEMARRNINGSDVVRVMDDDLGVVQFITITKEDITAAGKLRPIGARHYQAKSQLIQNMNGVFNSAIGQMIAPHVSSEKMASLVEELFGFEKYGIIQPNVAIMEQAKTQRLVNAAQEQVQTEAMMPAEPQTGVPM